MDSNTIASVLVGLFDTEAAVGLAMLAAVIIAIVHGLLKEHHHVGSDRAGWTQVRDIVFVAVVIAFFLLAALFVRVCEAIVGP